MVKKRKYEFKKDKRWKKIRFFSVLVLCASLLIICVISGVSKYRNVQINKTMNAVAQNNPELGETTKETKLYFKTNTTSKVLYDVPKGTKFTILSTEGNYYMVTFKGTDNKGYMGYILIEDTRRISNIEQTTKSIKLYFKPDKTSKVLTTIPAGSDVSYTSRTKEYTDNENNVYYMIIYKGTDGTGYMGYALNSDLMTNKTKEQGVSNQSSTSVQKQVEEEIQKAPEEEKPAVANETAKQQTQPTNNNKAIKVLLLGNSGTYMNGYGEVLSRFAKATGKNLLVVSATRGGAEGMGNKLITNNLNYQCWTSISSGCVYNNGSKKLKDIKNINFGNLNRTTWDYVILQNNAAINKLYDTDIKIFNEVKSNLISAKSFIVNSANYGKDKGRKRLPEHVSAMETVNGGVIATTYIVPEYSSSWTKYLTVGDNDGHASTQGAYMSACIVYSRIYGPSNLASSTSDTNFINVYGKNAVSSYHRKEGNTTYGAMEVNKETALKIQSFVYSKYSEYVMYK